jgi:hypothetical protein
LYSIWETTLIYFPVFDIFTSERFPVCHWINKSIRLFGDRIFELVYSLWLQFILFFFKVISGGYFVFCPFDNFIKNLKLINTSVYTLKWK